jgi:glycosyltransferase involved in cell wall biosynthesis
MRQSTLRDVPERNDHPGFGPAHDTVRHRADDTIQVAVDTGSLLGARTGIGVSVAAMLDAFTLLDDPPLVHPYVTSFRGSLPEGTTRLPLPAAVAHRVWGRIDRPRLDRWLGNVDVIHGPNHVVPPSRRPRLVSVYDTWFLRHPDDVHPDVRRMSQVLRRSVRSGAVIHTSSHATADQLRDVLSGDRAGTSDLRIEVVHLGALPVATPVDPQRSRFPALDTRRWILAMSTRERRKNLPALVRAFGLMAGDAASSLGDDVVLVIAGGPGNDDPAIAHEIAALPAAIGARVIITGRVDDDQKSWLLHGASVVAYPSLDEGFGHPLLEAMAAEVPVVASTAGSIPEIAGDAALLVDPSDDHALAAALLRALDDSGERARLVASGRERVRSFTWANTARGLADVYRALVMERTGS